MAWSSAVIPAADLANRALDIPLVIVNQLPLATSLNWQSQNHLTTWNNASFPQSRAYDGLTHLLTKTSAARTSLYFSAAWASPGVEVDCWCLVNHNLYTIGTTQARLTIADDADYSVNPASMTILAPTSNLRIAELTQKHTGSTARRYTAVQYMAFYVYFGGAAQTPQLGELFLGRSYQLPFAPEFPDDPDHDRRKSATTETESGVITETVHNAGKYVLSANIVTDGDTEAQVMKDFWKATGRGKFPFIWIPKPTSAPNTFYLMKFADDEFRFPKVYPSRREWQLNAIEQGPEAYHARVELGL